MRAIILAGGLGTRLRDAVPDVPKPLALVNGEPFLSLVMRNLRRNGVDEVILSIGHMGGMIREKYGDNFEGARILYSEESSPLGTGGALRKAVAMTTDKPALALNGDTYLDIDHSAIMRAHLAGGSDLTIALKPVADTNRFGKVEVEGGRVISFREKGDHGPGLINAGVYVINPGLFDGFSKAPPFSFETDFLPERLGALRPGCFIAQGDFIDIGTPEDYRRAQEFFAGI
ncbi:MAG: nucleotidyltransferase family protein [Nitrospinae bacterium]|nr:nucleotidyltransferase family protein [Nitrospinota bacterium]MBF0633170.1 nucleotidyltransferase family protein [Nitrospinota bacterium]